MMRLARRTTLLVAFYLLTSAATAFADCAWVLWSNYQTIKEVTPKPDGLLDFITDRSTQWTLETSFPSYRDCIWKRDEMYKKLWRRSPGRTLDEIIAGGRSPNIGDELWIPECFPDTIDPRGPKGK